MRSLIVIPNRRYTVFSCYSAFAFMLLYENVNPHNRSAEIFPFGLEMHRSRYNNSNNACSNDNNAAINNMYSHFFFTGMYNIFKRTYGIIKT